MPASKMRIQEIDREDGTPGRMFEFSDVKFTPLGFNDLKNAKLARPIAIPLKGDASIMADGVGLADASTRGSFDTYLNSHSTSTAIGLVRGGWLPSSLALYSDTIVLPDRCVVSQIKARLQNGVKKEGREKDFLDLFADAPVRINPMLFVLEGDTRQNPTSDQVQAQLNEAVTKLKSALPKATFIAADEHGLKGVLGLIEDTKKGMTQKEKFLLQIAPLLASPISKKKLPTRWSEVLMAAKDCGLSPVSLVVIAALSTVMMPNASSPTRGILKFGATYTKENAYNALADLRALEILMHLFACFPNQSLMLCTADKNLALFWTGLNASNFVFRNGRFSCDLTLSTLLPGMTDEQLQLLR